MFVPDQIETEHRITHDDEEYTYNPNSYNPEDNYQYDGDVDNADDYYDYPIDERVHDDDLSNDTSCLAQHDDYDYDEGHHDSHRMVVFFCDELFIDLKKCCDKNHNLNLR
jgi:hypothetical protein